MKNWLYLLITIIWTFILSFNILLFVELFFEITKFNLLNFSIAITFLIINLIFITILFCNSIKDFIFVLYYYIAFKRSQNSTILQNNIIQNNPKVILLYTTCNDFDEKSLKKCIKQKYSNFETFILDDSNNSKYIEKINNFIKKYPEIKIIRRENREGFKAGNINNFLQNYHIDYDYFVLLDSDEIIPNDFIIKCLPYFNNKKIGVVQANHKGTRSNNWFSFYGELGVYPSWTTFISIKNKYGTVTLNGHGAMISKECYQQSGGFPPIVAEDLGFTINLLNSGYQIAFAREIICEEVFPIDYLAFKKRAIKWTQGNIEFFKKYFLKILKLKIPFFQKLDLWLSITSLSLTIFSLFILIINFSILYPLGFNYASSNQLILWIEFALMIIFAITPFINDFIFLIKRMNFFKLIFYILFCLLLYTSLIVCTIKTLLLSLSLEILSNVFSYAVIALNALGPYHEKLLYTFSISSFSLFVKLSSLISKTQMDLFFKVSWSLINGVFSGVIL